MKIFNAGMICLLILFAAVLSAETYEYEQFEQTYTISGDEPLMLIIDVDVGELRVHRSSADREVSVNAEYIPSHFRLDVDYREEKNRLKITLDKRSWHKWPRERDDECNRSPVDIELGLPAGATLILDTRMKAGELSMSLGGLRIQEFSLSFWAGEARVDFDQPNQITMDYMDIDAKVGEAVFRKMGNARFQTADINGGIGEISIDFTGDLLEDSRARVDLDIGEASILVPGDKGIRMSIGGGLGFLSQKNIDLDFYKRGRYYYSENYEGAKDRFSLRVTPGLGELTIDRD